MTSFIIRELKSTDTEALLAFELRNRHWFEANIDARATSFYSPEGVADHIAGYLSDFASGAWHPLVIEHADGSIVGRANLKSIDSVTACAEVGYRIDQHACGQGLATLALRHMIEQARVRWKLTQLVAYAYQANLGSQKVLDRCGFVLEHADGDDEPAKERRFVLSIHSAGSLR